MKTLTKNEEDETIIINRPDRSTYPGEKSVSRSGATPNNNGRSTMIHVLWMFIVGLVVGAIARMIDPAAGHMGLIMTGILGIVGSIVGGFIARLFSKPAPGAPFHPAGIIMSIIGAVIVIWVWTHLVGVQV
jgi:uncharacterized membrane protein YeaQ/YmgE (transglycosylase-associated protein family)